jgi:hypothetical protein
MDEVALRGAPVEATAYPLYEVLEIRPHFFLPSFAFTGRVHFSPLQVPFPGRPSPCLCHYSRALGYYAASALSSTRWHSRVPKARVQWRESSPVPRRKLIVPDNCLLYAGWIGDNMCTQCRNGTPPTIPFGLGVSTTFTYFT